MEKLRLLPLLLVFVFMGCQEANREPLVGANGEPVIFASIPPLATLVEKIAGEQAEVRSLAGENQDPHDFSPTPKQLVDLTSSAAFFTTGMPFEDGLVEKLQRGARQLRIIDVAGDIELLEFDCLHEHENDDEVYTFSIDDEAEHDHEGHDHEGHDHEGHDHEGHDHSRGDPHIWLSPPLLKEQVGAIVEALKKIIPEHGDAFVARGDEVNAEIEALHTELTEKLAPFRGRKFYVYHGAFAYFAQAYGLEQEAIEIGGRRPEQKRIVSLIESARADGVKTIFVQPQFDPASAKNIADEIGGKVVPIDPLAPDLFANLRRIAETIGSMKQGD